jgi:hypothetical protein
MYASVNPFCGFHWCEPDAASDDRDGPVRIEGENAGPSTLSETVLPFADNSTETGPVTMLRSLNSMSVWPSSTMRYACVRIVAG